mgnify:CR=1 FL=1
MRSASLLHCSSSARMNSSPPESFVAAGQDLCLRQRKSHRPQTSSDCLAFGSAGS